MKKKPVKKEPEDKKLTIKENIFVREYLKDFNATQAYKRSGFKGKSTRQLAYNLLSKVYIQKEIKTQVEARYKRLDMDGDRVLQELDYLATSDIKDLFDENNCIKKIKDIPRELTRCISAIEVSEIWEWEDGERTQIGEKVKVKFWDKPKSLELKGRYHKLFTDKIEITVDENLALQLKQGRERLKRKTNNG